MGTRPDYGYHYYMSHVIVEEDQVLSFFAVAGNEVMAGFSLESVDGTASNL